MARWLPVLLVGSATCVMGCIGDPLLIGELTSLTIVVGTRLEDGLEISPPPYTAYVQDSGTSNNRQERPIPPNGTVTFDDLGDGFAITAGIEDLPAGCTGEGALRTSVVVGQESNVGFQVVCRPTP